MKNAGYFYVIKIIQAHQQSFVKGVGNPTSVEQQILLVLMSFNINNLLCNLIYI